MSKISVMFLGVSILLELTVIAADTNANTNTSVTFKAIPEPTEDIYNTGHLYYNTDAFGNSYYDREATITTKNFKVQNFWSKFREGGKSESIFSDISRKGLFRITTETTSACTLESTLPEEGCSGQKPFLINDETLENPISGTDDEYEVVFTEASKYSDTASNTFYPLDIARDEQYYTNPDPDSPEYSRSGFFGFVTSAVDGLFNLVVHKDLFGVPTAQEEVLASRGISDEDRRQKYITNIMAGIEQKERLKMSLDGYDATQIDYLDDNYDSYKLDYAQSKKTTMYDYCNAILIDRMNGDGLFCKLVDFASLNALLPFVDSEANTTIESNMILTDTENALLAMTGEIDEANRNTIETSSDVTDPSFLKQIIKPVGYVLGIVKDLLFTEEKASSAPDPQEKVYAFDEDTAMTLTIPVTNTGDQVDSFANFKLLKIRSVYGSQVKSCTVKSELLLKILDVKTKTFVQDDDYVKPTDYKRPLFKSRWTNNDWVDWCAEETGDKGLFAYLIAKEDNPLIYVGKLLVGLVGEVVELLYNIEITQVGYETTRGLVLDLKRVDPDPTSKVNRYKIDVLEMQNIY